MSVRLWSLIGAYLLEIRTALAVAVAQTDPACSRSMLSEWPSFYVAKTVDLHTQQATTFTTCLCAFAEAIGECAMHFTLSVQPEQLCAAQLYYFFVVFFRHSYGTPQLVIRLLCGMGKKETIRPNDLLTEYFFSGCCCGRLADSEMWYCRAHACRPEMRTESHIRLRCVGIGVVERSFVTTNRNSICAYVVNAKTDAAIFSNW